MCSHVSVCPQGGVSVSGPRGMGVCHTPRQTPPQRTHSLGRHSPLQTPPTGRTTPLGRHSPLQTPPAQCMLGYTPSACWNTHTHYPVHAEIHTPPAQCMLGYGQQVSGTHPTGVHSFPSYICVLRMVRQSYDSIYGTITFSHL